MNPPSTYDLFLVWHFLPLLPFMATLLGRVIQGCVFQFFVSHLSAINYSDPTPNTEETAFPCYHRQPPYCQILSLTYLTSLLHLKWSIIPSFLKVFLPLVLLSCCSPITIALSHSPLPLPSLIRYWNRQESSVLSALFLTAKVLGNLICTLGSLLMTHECVSTAISLIGKIKNMGI